MSGTISLQLLAGIILIGAMVTTIVLTRNSSRLRQNFFRQLTYFIALPLFIILSSSLIGTILPPKPIDLSKISGVVDAETVRDEVRSYAEQMETYLDYQRFTVTLWIVCGFLFSILPTASFAYNYMRHLEKTGTDENDRIF